MPQYLPLPNGAYYEVPDETSYADALAQAQQKYPDAFLSPEQAAAKDSKRGFGSSFARSFGHTLSEQLPEAQKGIAALARDMGADSIARFMEPEKKKPPKHPEEEVAPVSWKDIKDWKSFKQFAGEAAGSGVGGTLVPLAAGLGTTALTGNPVLGGIAGLASMAPGSIGSTQQALEDAGVAPEEASKYAVPAGALQAGIYGIPIAGLGARALGRAAEKETIQALADRLATQSGKGWLKGAAEGAGTMAVASPASLAVQQAAVAHATGQPFATDENIDALKTAAASGALGMIPVGAVLGRYHHAKQQQAVDAFNEQKKALEYQAEQKKKELEEQKKALAIGPEEGASIFGSQRTMQEAIFGKREFDEIPTQELEQKILETRQAGGDPRLESFLTSKLQQRRVAEEKAARTEAEKQEAEGLPRQVAVLQREFDSNGAAMQEAGAAGNMDAVQRLSKRGAQVQQALKQAQKRAGELGVDLRTPDEIHQDAAKQLAKAQTQLENLLQTKNDPVKAGELATKIKELQQRTQEVAPPTTETAQPDLFAAADQREAQAAQTKEQFEKFQAENKAQQEAQAKARAESVSKWLAEMEKNEATAEQERAAREEQARLRQEITEPTQRTPTKEETTPLQQRILNAESTGVMPVSVQKALLGKSYGMELDLNNPSHAREVIPELFRAEQALDTDKLTPESADRLRTLQNLQKYGRDVLRSGEKEELQLPNVEGREGSFEAPTNQTLGVDADAPQAALRRQQHATRLQMDAALGDFETTLDDLRRGVFLDGPNPAGASSTKAALQKQARDHVSALEEHFLRDIALQRAIEGRRALTEREVAEARIRLKRAASDGSGLGLLQKIESAINQAGKIKHDEYQLRKLRQRLAKLEAERATSKEVLPLHQQSINAVQKTIDAIQKRLTHRQEFTNVAQFEEGTHGAQLRETVRLARERKIDAAIAKGATPQEVEQLRQEPITLPTGETVGAFPPERAVRRGVKGAEVEGWKAEMDRIRQDLLAREPLGPARITGERVPFELQGQTPESMAKREANTRRDFSRENFGGGDRAFVADKVSRALALPYADQIHPAVRETLEQAKRVLDDDKGSERLIRLAEEQADRLLTRQEEPYSQGQVASASLLGQMREEIQNATRPTVKQGEISGATATQQELFKPTRREQALQTQAIQEGNFEAVRKGQFGHFAPSLIRRLAKMAGEVRTRLQGKEAQAKIHRDKIKALEGKIAALNEKSVGIKHMVQRIEQGLGGPLEGFLETPSERFTPLMRKDVRNERLYRVYKEQYDAAYKKYPELRRARELYLARKKLENQIADERSALRNLYPAPEAERAARESRERMEKAQSELERQTLRAYEKAEDALQALRHAEIDPQLKHLDELISDTKKDLGSLRRKAPKASPFTALADLQRTISAREASLRLTKDPALRAAAQRELTSLYEQRRVAQDQAKNDVGAQREWLRERLANLQKQRDALVDRLDVQFTSDMAAAREAANKGLVRAAERVKKLEGEQPKTIERTLDDGRVQKVPTQTGMEDLSQAQKDQIAAERAQKEKETAITREHERVKEAIASRLGLPATERTVEIAETQNPETGEREILKPKKKDLEAPTTPTIATAPELKASRRQVSGLYGEGSVPADFHLRKRTRKIAPAGTSEAAKTPPSRTAEQRVMMARLAAAEKQVAATQSAITAREVALQKAETANPAAAKKLRANIDALQEQLAVQEEKAADIRHRIDAEGLAPLPPGSYASKEKKAEANAKAMQQLKGAEKETTKRFHAAQSLRTGSAEQKAAKEYTKQRQEEARRKRLEETGEEAPRQRELESWDLEESEFKANRDRSGGDEDGTVFNTRPTDASVKTGIEVHQRGREMVDQIKKRHPELKVVYADTMASAPEGFKNAVKRGMAPGDSALGGVMPDGTVVLIGEGHKSVADLENTAAHEIIGHYGVDGALGKEGFGTLTNRVWKGGEESVRAIAKGLGIESKFDDIMSAQKAFAEWQKENPGKAKATTDFDTKLAITRELVADAARPGLKVPKQFAQPVRDFIKRIASAVRSAWYAPMGMKTHAAKTTDQIYKLLQDSARVYDSREAYAPYQSPSERTVFNTAALRREWGDGVADMVGGKERWYAPIRDAYRESKLGLFLETQTVDRLAAVSKALEEGLKRQGLDPHDFKWTQTMFWNRAVSDETHHVTDVLSNGAKTLLSRPRAGGGYETTFGTDAKGRGISMPEVLKPLKRVDKDPDNAVKIATMYGAMQRAQRVGFAKLNLDFIKDKAKFEKDLEKFKENLRAKPDVKAALDEWWDKYQDYNAGLIDMLVATEAIPKEMGEQWKATRDYMPFYRTDGKMVKLFFGDEHILQIGDMTHQPQLRELIGGKQPIMDFFASSVKNTHLVMHKALMNKAAKETAFMLDSLGLTAKDEGANSGVHRGYGNDNPNSIRFNVEPQDGKDDGRRHVVVDTDSVGVPPEMVMYGMRGIATQLPWIVRLLSAPGNWIRKFVTRNPMYAVRQFYNDLPSYMFTSGAAPNFGNIGRNLKEVWEGSSAEQKRLQEMGLLGGNVYTGTMDDLARVSRQMVAENLGGMSWHKAMAMLDRNGVKADAFSRVHIYNDLRRQGMSEVEAVMAAREALDFSRRGASVSLHWLTSMIPFMNTQMQSVRSLVKAARGTSPFQDRLKLKQKFLQRGLMMAGASLAYAAAMQNNDAYKNATPYERYYYWFVPVPGMDEPLRVRIPFESGILFKAIPEAMFQMAQGTEVSKEALKGVWQAIMNSNPFNLPPAMRLGIEQATNTSLFTGQPLENQRLQKFDPHLRYNANTTETAKALSKGMKEMGMDVVSPIRIENVVNNLTSGTGLALLSMFDPLVRSMQDEVAGQVEGKASTMPLFGKAFQPNDAAGIVNTAYDATTQWEERSNTFKELIAEGKEKQAKEYAQEYAKEIALGGSGGVAPKFAKKMGELKKLERAILEAPEERMSPQMKRVRLDALRQAQIKLANQIKQYRLSL